MCNLIGRCDYISNNWPSYSYLILIVHGDDFSLIDKSSDLKVTYTYVDNYNSILELSSNLEFGTFQVFDFQNYCEISMKFSGQFFSDAEN